MSAPKQIQLPGNVVHKFLTDNQRVCVWLMHDNHIRLEGVLRGYDEFYNVVLDDASEVHVKSNKAKLVGTIMLKGDTVGLIHPVGI